MVGKSVLISGASIAGPALAYWLHRFGMEPIVVERTPALRPGGQTVDVRGVGRAVVQRMGIEDAVRAASTGEEGVRFVDEHDRSRAEFGVGAFGGEGIVAELEILRGSGLLYVLGDAGYCASPISGQGTSLALVGAYVLAGELARQPDHRAAFAASGGRMRPYVSEAQKLPPGAPRLSSPRSRTGIRLYHAALRAAASPMVGRLAQRFSASSGEKFVLPEYAPH